MEDFRHVLTTRDNNIQRRRTQLTDQWLQLDPLILAMHRGSMTCDRAPV